MRTISASAPGRCGIVGNPSDIYGGTVVSCSIPARATCTLTLGGDSRLPEDTRLWDAAVARFPLDGLVAVDWQTEVPRSAGLSGSTALLSATLACVLAARGEAPDLETREGRTQFAELVRDVERHEAGVMCGYQDAYMIVHGGMQRMDFVGKHPVEPGPHAQLQPIRPSDLPFLLVTTGVERLSGSVHGPMAERWLSGEELVRANISRITHLGREGAEAIAQADWDRVAELMNENHRLIAELGGSGDAIDQLVGACIASGAKAAKLAGAGMGGTVIALAEDVEALEHTLRSKGYSRFLRPELCPGTRLETGSARPETLNNG